MSATMPKDEKVARVRLAETRPDLERGAEVVVDEEGIPEWPARVTAVKPSLVSGWWIEVADDRGTWSIHASRVRRGEE